MHDPQSERDALTADLAYWKGEARQEQENCALYVDRLLLAEARSVSSVRRWQPCANHRDADDASP